MGATTIARRHIKRRRIRLPLVYMEEHASSRSFTIHSPKDFDAVEAYILSQLRCDEGRCSFFRTADYLCLRREVLYGIPRARGVGCLSVACAPSGLYVCAPDARTVVVSWSMPPMVEGMHC